MATLQNKRIKNTYQGLLKTEDNGNLNSSQKEITDGQGTGSGVYLDTNGNLKANGTIEFGSLKDTGEDITITKLVDLADGIENNDNDTTIPTTAAIKSYADSKTAPINTVNGQTGDVVLDTDDISEGTTNLYYTESRVSANTSVAANTNKTGITTQQASDIEINNAKISFDSTSSTKLTGIETGAQVNTVDSVNSQIGTVSLGTDDVSEGITNLYYTDTRVVANSAVTANTAKNSYPSADSTKLANIESGAEVNVQSNWNETDTNSDSFILNKPTIPTAAVDSVNTQIGDVVLDTDDIAEGTSNLYYTDARVSANTNVTANTAKVGITTQQASDITTNNAKVGITTQQASDITTNNSKVGITTTQADAITANTAKVGITTEQSNAIVTNTAKVGITTQQSSDIVTNNAKVGITTTQANEITANTSKVGITTQQASDITTNNAKVGITTQQASDITSNNAKVGITTTQANNITTNNAKISFDSTSSTKLAGIEAGAEVNTVDSVNGQTGAVSLSTSNISEGSNLYYTDVRVTANSSVSANTAKISYNTTDSTKVGYISITQAVDLDVVENKQDNQYKIIGIAMDYSNRVLSDNGTAEGSQSIMENIETLILN